MFKAIGNWLSRAFKWIGDTFTSIFKAIEDIVKIIAAVIVVVLIIYLLVVSGGLLEAPTSEIMFQIWATLIIGVVIGFEYLIEWLVAVVDFIIDLIAKILIKAMDALADSGLKKYVLIGLGIWGVSLLATSQPSAVAREERNAIIYKREKKKDVARVRRGLPPQAEQFKPKEIV